MSRPAAPRPISQFSKDPNDLAAQLSRFEEYLRTELASVDAWALWRFEPTGAQRTAYTAKIGQHVIASTIDGDLLLDLPAASSENVGRMVALTKLDVANNVVVRSIGQTVGFGVTDTVTTSKRLYLYISTRFPDGCAWVRTG